MAQIFVSAWITFSLTFTVFLLLRSETLDLQRKMQTVCLHLLRLAIYNNRFANQITHKGATNMVS